MKYATAAAFRRALEQRLADRARQTGGSLARLRKAVVFERLLARLVSVAPNRWVLKGALALDFRLSNRTRTTKDMDLVRLDDESAMAADFAAAQAIDLGDFMMFGIEKIAAPTDGLEFLCRYHVRAELAGRVFDNALVDVSFLDPLHWPPDSILTPDMLSFAGIAPVRVPILPREQHVVEKVHGYTRTYSGGRPSSRVKDLVDLVLIKQTMDLDAARLGAAFEGVFSDRAQHQLPVRLPRPPDGWAVPYRKLAIEVGRDPALAAGHEEASLLVDPVLSGLRIGKWNPTTGRWA